MAAVPVVGLGRGRRANWSNRLICGIEAAAILAAAGLLYGDVLAGLASDWWTEPNLSHGLLVPPLAAWVIWVQRHETFAQPAAPDSRGLLVTFVACAAYVLGKLGAEFFLQRFSFVLLLAGAAWTFWGLRRLRKLAFPLLLLATMVPLPSIFYQTASAPLQLLASDAATSLLHLLGVTVYRDGNLIYLAGATLGVSEACSGLSTLSTLVVASLLLGFLLCPRRWARTMLLALAIPIGIAANVIRVLVTAVLAEYRHDFAMGFYHFFSGWLVFVAGFGMLYAAAAIANLRARAACQ
jgi:exosortase